MMEPLRPNKPQFCIRAIRWFLCVFNVILFVFFDCVLLASVIFRYIPNVTSDFLSLILTNSKLDDSQREVILYIEDNTAAVTIASSIVAAVFTICSMMGALSSQYDPYLIAQATVLAILLVTESIVVAVIFGVPGIFPNVVYRVLNKTLRHYNSSGDAGIISRALWNIITTDDEEFCCGLYNWDDYKNTTAYPQGCCSQMHQEQPCAPRNLTHGLPTCRKKVNTFIKEERVVLIVICVVFILVQLILFSLSVVTLRFSNQKRRTGRPVVLSKVN